ncbi:DEAD/DEAH box helicase [Providencia vermicola]|uniref:DEAD/DEAH box helicase n=2 Tax=Providencia TaxID=586 RepID=A0AAI9HZI8_PROST|nr:MULTISPECIES: DEAD/DEAH box helicase [Providencia]ELR5044867.1 DEAD/DEAH box helicase [Providencia rettgeri]ELR5035474.1 DEAD/DEAH box helicase [Providencia stuartii]ELR5120008.1 DEAD/DEAH box helicase [Providencia stuartii]ELR5141764.1 DEAD/DEAH box helicase [Providencia stuartii]ELR5291115.1 DEAD/DEAH box helicase [Providencia stuartii]
MAKTNNIIQAKESSYMKDNVKTPSSESVEGAEVKTEVVQDKKFKEVVCPKVPTSYFKRAKRQRTK